MTWLAVIGEYAMPCLTIADAARRGDAAYPACMRSHPAQLRTLPVPQVGDEALQLALEEQREQCATLEARLATTQVSGCLHRIRSRLQAEL